MIENKRNPYLINRAFNTFLFAAILATASSNLAVVIDGVIVGQLLGANSLAAINLTMPLMQFIFTIVMILSVGTSILTAISLGKGDNDSGNRYFSFAVIMSASIGVIMSIIGAAFSHQIAALLCSNAELLPLVEEYIYVILISAPIYFLLPVLCTFMRIDGVAKLTATAMIVANVVNISFDMILIKGFGMGIEGSSIATTIGNLTGIGVLLTHLLSKRCNLKLRLPRPKTLNISKATVLGLPTAMTSALITVKLIVTNYIILDSQGTLGASYLAASMSLMMIVSLFVGGVSQSVQPIGGVLIGQQDNRGLQLLVNKAIRLLFISVVIVLLVIEIFTSSVAGFFGISDPATINDAVSAIRLVTLSFLPFALTYFLIVVYQLSNRTLLAIIISIVQPSLVAIVMFIVNEVAPQLVWWSFLISELLVFIAIYIISIVKHSKERSIEPLTLLKIEKQPLCCDFSVDASNPESLAITLNELDDFFNRNNIELEAANQLRLVTEELVDNILKFGYTKSLRHYIDIRVVINEKTINLCIKDDGVPFNPLENRNVNDGLGLKILQSFSSKIEYKYLLNQNTTFLSIDI